MTLALLGLILAGLFTTAHAQSGDIAEHLSLVQIIDTEYILELRSSENYPCQVTLTTPEKRRVSYFVRPGETFGMGNRFKALKLEPKEVPGPNNTIKDASELTVEDVLRKNTFVLVMKVAKKLHLPEVVLEYRLKTIETIKAKEGDFFRIPGSEDTTFKVLKVQDDSATIAPLKPDRSPGKEIVLKRRGP